MRYLYGDSSESDLEINYLAFLRDAVDFGVDVVRADTALAALRERKVARERDAAEAALSVEEFGRAATSLTDPLAKGEAPINRCAAAIAQATADAVKREVGRVRAQLAQEAEQIDGEVRAQHERAAQALGKLLAAHDLPAARETITVRWTGAGFAARLAQRAPIGVEATLALDVPAGSLFAHELRVERVGDGVEIHAPETAGWLKKEMKMMPHKLGRHHVTEVVVAPDGVTARVRAALDGTGAGFDVVAAANGTVSVARSGEADGAFATDDRDVPVLRAFAAKLEEAARALRTSRGAIAEVAIDGAPLAAHEHPRVIVERLVASIAPVVAEIARRCPSPRELVLKRLLGGDRREEIFLARAELTARLEPLAAADRRVFAPLGIVAEAEQGDARLASDEVITSAPDPHRAPTVQVPADHPLPDEARPPIPDRASSVDSQPIVIDAEPPPPPRTARRTMPPPPPIPPAPPSPGARATGEGSSDAVDAALRDLDQAESGPIVTSAPSPPRPRSEA